MTLYSNTVENNYAKLNGSQLLVVCVIKNLVVKARFPLRFNAALSAVYNLNSSGARF